MDNHNETSMFIVDDNTRNVDTSFRNDRFSNLLNNCEEYLKDSVDHSRKYKSKYKQNRNQDENIKKNI